jgi:hypothetical protein
MTSVAVLIDKLTNIELSIGVKEDCAVRNLVLDAQDCALQIQREVAEILRSRSRHNAVRLTSYLCFGGLLIQLGWHRAFAAIRSRASVE